MSVNQHGGTTLHVRALRPDHGMGVAGEQRRLATQTLQLVGEPLRRGLTIVVVFRGRRDAGNAQEFLQASNHFPVALAHKLIDSHVR